MNKLILSLFPGIDILGHGFEINDFCVVQAQDKITGGDIRRFSPPSDVFEGVVGGSPCQDFSLLNRSPGDYSQEMLDEYVRVVSEAKPYWFLHENVATVPDFKIEGYYQQRFDLNLAWFSDFSRLRHFTFGCLDKKYLNPMHKTGVSSLGVAVTSKDKRSFRECCDIQGLPRTFDLPSFNSGGKKLAVANAVPLPMAQYVASLINERIYSSRSMEIIDNRKFCLCGCGRQLVGLKKTASSACRKRLSRQKMKK